MDMKKIVILVLIVIAAAVFFFTRDNNVQAPTENQNTGSNFRPDPSGATFTGLELGGEVTLLQERGYGDINSDSKVDTATFLAESGGGSGVFIYAAAYVSGPVNYKGSNAVFLGDRISPQKISITSGVITISYLDRKPDEPFAAEPTVPVSKQFIYKNGELVEK
ncbi:MAG: hypothetical protein A3D49_01300 [Candidatus Zambryskibacteria bacterium RIFCSPHIGHO2_02_FULL_43_37]|uniref:Uncharacterized protein n=1 Tax=Candidatus Zambryskibacteria bacterium RIFCSPHIGHO2_02_FULL_43_37 TaxID=1802749 RepID=A0A1G2TGS3_9BACT|nr:MAG: hypothetical protein A2723_01600 [Candidatus Zambryskibacteria bacterium RIFCSPHIGHO2_01_FULL_52_18]OHA96496.1 MAG: hypothetical protein A3D49_01300 [Candidatus Zambryskibacteria bacterium RIFCSPHIGHO2_02_FULL_43_37]